MSDTVIRIENVGKRYQIGMLHRYKQSFRDRFFELLRCRRKGTPKPHPSIQSSPARPPSPQQDDDLIWALKGISFQVHHGEILGIIGSNGAGKSTLLKILSRITKPTQGRVLVKGRVGSLLEVGTGFHPELTGRENIYLNGAILGMKRAEIANKFDEIVAFSEIEAFIDTPVKRYSSGMYMRLAFAVAAHLEPDILLVDEVLAVGDAAFQKKCLGKMGHVAREGRTVIFVSHNMSIIQQLCPRTLLLESGTLRMDDHTEKVIEYYLTRNAETDARVCWPNGFADPGVEDLVVRSVGVINQNNEYSSKLDVRKPFWIESVYSIKMRCPVLCIGVKLTTAQGIRVFEAYDTDDMKFRGVREPGTYNTKIMIPGNLLNSGRYFVTLYFGIPKVKHLAHLDNILLFDIELTGEIDSHTSSKRQGVLFPKFQWECKVVSGEP